LGADGIVDYFGDLSIGRNTYSASAFCNSKWSSDGGHLNDAGKEIMGRLEVREIQRLLAAR